MTFFDSSAAHLSLIFCGIFFLTGLITGCWKYFAMIKSETKQAPYYVDIAHRASLMYTFAALVLAVFTELSIFSNTINFFAALMPLIFFSLSIGAYIFQGFLNKTDNQLRDHPQTVFMWALMFAEIGGVATLFLGFLLSL